jgi:ferredoxin
MKPISMELILILKIYQWHLWADLLMIIIVVMDILITKVRESLKLLFQENVGIRISRRIIEKNVSTNEVLFKSKVLNFMGKAESPAAKLFGLELHANNDCTTCGTCWSNCPEQNIKQKNNGKPGFGLKCIMCMRCIYNCPEKAISPRISKFIPIKNGYKLSKYVKD